MEPLTTIRYIKMVLLPKNKLGFIDGFVVKPPDLDPNSGVWERCNRMVVPWLHTATIPHIRLVLALL